jgi:hypothetical protein
MLGFFRESRANGECVSGVLLKAKALVIARDLNIQGFMASQGWLNRFLERNNLVRRYFYF